MQTTHLAVLNKLGHFKSIEPDPEIEIDPGANSKTIGFKQDNVKYVLKRLSANPNELVFKDQIRSFIREIACLIIAEDPFVLQVYKWNFFDVDKIRKCYICSPTMVSKYCEGKNLYIYQHERRKTRDQKVHYETQNFILALGIALGMENAHQHGVLHRDLKNENVLIAAFEKDPSYNIPIIGDFGYAKTVRETMILQSRTCGTYFFMAPEMMNSREYSFPADVYSYSIVLSTIFNSSSSPNYDSNITRIILSFIKHIQNGDRPLTDKFNKAQIDLLEKLWDPCPSQRLTFSEIVEYLRSLENRNRDDLAFNCKIIDWNVVKLVNEYYNKNKNKNPSRVEENNFNLDNLEITFSNSKKSKTDESFYRLTKDDVNEIIRNANNAHPQYIDLASLMYRSGRAFETNLSYSLKYATISENNSVVTTMMKMTPLCSQKHKLDYIKGALFESNGNFQSAQESYIQAIKEGSIEAVYKLGTLLLDSDDTDKMKNGWKLIQKAAGLGDKDALFTMGNYLANGNQAIGVKANLAYAARSFQQSAERGRFDGWFQAATLYHKMAIDTKNHQEKQENINKAITAYNFSYTYYNDVQGKQLADQLSKRLTAQ